MIEGLREGLLTGKIYAVAASESSTVHPKRSKPGGVVQTTPAHAGGK
jgi:hypothetical protein